jgi:hypothetical protein
MPFLIFPRSLHASKNLGVWGRAPNNLSEQHGNQGRKTICFVSSFLDKSIFTKIWDGKIIR